MSIILLQKFCAAAGCYDEVADTMATMLKDTAARKGAMTVRAAGNPETGVITLLQEWDGPENQQAYSAWRVANTDMTRLMSLLTQPPESEQLLQIF